MNNPGRFWRNFDWIMAGTVLALMAIGILVIWSTSFKATTLASNGDTIKQLIGAVLGSIVMIVVSRIDYRLWGRLAPYFYGITVILLVAVLFSHAVLGAQRWIPLGPIQLQPSELAKLALIISLSRFLSKQYDRLSSWRYLAVSLLYLAVPMALVLRQPDLGTALVLGFTWLTMILVSRISKKQLAVLGGIGLACLPFLISHLKDYQKSRLTVFLNPQSDPLGAGHNVIQSTITIGSGQLFGRGLAAGSQSQLNFLPQLAQHTDFIFAVLGEKLGFVAGALLIGLFGVLIWRGLTIAYRATDRFGFFVATGVTAMFFCHIFINIGMNMALAPVTGIPLPFVSYGGTALLIDLVAVGLLQSIATRRQKSD